LSFRDLLRERDMPRKVANVILVAVLLVVVIISGFAGSQVRAAIEAEAAADAPAAQELTAP